MATPITRNFGWARDLPDHRDLMFSLAAPPAAPLPSRVDLRPQCPAIVDQGELGSCTANAIAGALLFAEMKEKAPYPVAKSRLFIYYNERVKEHTVKSDAGAQIRDGINSVAHQGVCPEAEWPYDITKFADKPTTACYGDAVKYKALLYRAVTQNLAQLRACLASGYPIVFGFTVYESFMSQQVAGSGMVPMPAAGEPGAGPNGQPAGHAVVAVGYDDSTSQFIVRNSWGTDWGIQGYCMMPYAYLLDANLADSFWTISSTAS